MAHQQDAFDQLIDPKILKDRVAKFDAWLDRQHPEIRAAILAHASKQHSATSTDRDLTTRANQILDYLNGKRRAMGIRGSGFRASKTNLRPIMGRIKETDVTRCRAVIAVCARETQDRMRTDPGVARYFTPQSIFRPSNFERWLAKTGG